MKYLDVSHNTVSLGSFSDAELLCYAMCVV